MYLRIVGESLRRRARAKLAALFAVALGAGAAGGLVMLFLGVGDRMAAELRRFGANIEILPGHEPLAEESLPRLQETFWRNQIVRVIPELRFEAGGFTVVGREPDPGWRIQGRPGVLAGIALGLGPGATVEVGRPLKVTVVVETGGEEDGQVIVPLALTQEIAGRRGRLTRVLGSAVVRPETDEYRPLRRGERRFSPEKVREMACTNFPDNVARDFGAALDAEARVIRPVTDREGAVLQRVNRVVWLLGAAALVAGGLSVLAAMSASVVDRRKEVGLLKALGATDASIATVFMGEGLVIAVAGSLAGYVIAVMAANAMSGALFGSRVAGSTAVYLVTLAAAIAIVGLGALWPLRRILRIEPHRVLHEV
jgi:putative ABC transport system permease protein